MIAFRIYVHRFFPLLALLRVRTLERDESVRVEPHADLDAHGIRRVLHADALGGELPDPWVDPAGEQRWLCVRRLELESLLAVEREHLGRRKRLPAREHNKFRVLIRVGRRALPLHLDGVVCDAS